MNCLSSQSYVKRVKLDKNCGESPMLSKLKVKAMEKGKSIDKV